MDERRERRVRQHKRLLEERMAREEREHCDDSNYERENGYFYEGNSKGMPYAKELRSKTTMK